MMQTELYLHQHGNIERSYKSKAIGFEDRADRRILGTVFCNKQLHIGDFTNKCRNATLFTSFQEIFMTFFHGFHGLKFGLMKTKLLQDFADKDILYAANIVPIPQKIVYTGDGWLELFDS